jgi:hypothetical protein
MMSSCHSFQHFIINLLLLDYTELFGAILSYLVLLFILRHEGLLTWRCYSQGRSSI